MTRKELEALAERYQKKADRAYESHQGSGLPRYYREYMNNEELADALRMAARSADDAVELSGLRVTLAGLATDARRIKRLGCPHEEIEPFLDRCISEAVVRDMIHKDD